MANDKTSSRRQDNEARKTRNTNKPRIGGTAVSGAKSTQPKEVSKSSDPNQQQIAGYNRTMRRRMEHLGAGPYAQSQAENLQEKRKRRLERRKQRHEERRQTVLKSMPRSKISLGRRSTYFVIGVAVVVVLIIVAFIILHQMGLIGA